MVELVTVNKALPNCNPDYHKKGDTFLYKIFFKNNKSKKIFLE